MARRIPEWKHIALSSIGGKTTDAARSKGGKRLAWKIAWDARDKRVFHIDLAPLEQTLQATGWSRGKIVSLKRLFHKANSLTALIDQDYRAASTIRESRGYYGVDYTIEAFQTLEVLAGHPFLFNEEGGRVEVAADEPRLMATEESGYYHLRLVPFPENGNQRYIVHEDGPNCLRVTRFEERHVKIAKMLGENGIFLPERVKDTLSQTLGNLASVVTIHSNIKGAVEGVQQVKADTRLYVQIQSMEEGLDVEVAVRPLGPNGAPCRPGVGGSCIFGLADSRRVYAKRDLDAEKDAFMLTLRSCPALIDAEQTSDKRWRLKTPELALEFLAQVQELGDLVVTEWPKGQTMRVGPPITMSSLRVTARGVQDWFALSGQVRIDESLVLSIKDLMGLLKVGHGRFLPLGDGRFAALTKEFHRRLEELAALGDLKEDEARVSPLAVELLTYFAEAAGSFEGDAEWERQKARVTKAVGIAPPSTFKGQLRRYQLEGFQWMSRLALWGVGACLADDMGLGKTIQVLALLVARGSGGPALVAAPTSVCSNWISEAHRFSPTLTLKELRYSDRKKMLEELGQFDVVVTTYGLLQNEIERLSTVRWHTIVLDEAQAIKNMDAKRSAAAMKLSGDFRVATTGTPLENHLNELWNLFRFLNPNYLGSFKRFNQRFAAPIERDGDKATQGRLKRAIQPFILRRTKEQVLEELPPKTEITLRVELREEEQAFYELLRRNAVKELSAADDKDRRFKIFAQLMRLRRACCNVQLTMPEAKKLPSAKLEAFAEILEDLRENGHKALVFSQFVDHLTIIRRFLDEKGVAYQYLDGSTPPQERIRRVAAFQAGEGDCFLISLKAGGMGLNLTAADYVVHMDPWWNPAVEAQASDRAHRMGQKRPVTVYRIVAKGTVEEKIVDLHVRKRDLAENLLDEAGTPPPFSAEEMLALIREVR
jgi:superfamily II DNA or RNA helicase